MISSKSLKINLKKYKITTYTPEVLSSVNTMLEKFIALKLAKCIKKGGGVNGDYFLPSEYYGVDSGRYVEAPEAPSTNANEDFIRPALDVNILDMNGGANKFSLSKTALEESIKKANKDKIKISKTTKGMWQKEFQNLLDEILKKVVKKDGNFAVVLKIKKYSKYL